MKKLISLPDFHDDDKNIVGQNLNVILLSTFGLLSLYEAYRLISGFSYFGTTDFFITGILVLAIALRIILQYGYVNLASLLLTGAAWAGMTYQAYSADGVRDITITSYIVVILLSSLLLGWKYSLPFFVISIGSVWYLAIAETSGAQTFSSDTPINIAIGLSVTFTLVVVVVYLIIRRLQRSAEMAKASAQELMVSNQELQALRVNLEQRVAARTRDLEIVAEVGTATATILNPAGLLQEVVDLTKERFHLYHSHIYLLDEKGENLVLTAGAGEAGRVMVAKGHSIPLDRERSLVARAARERKGVTVNDVTQAHDFLPNPLLPETHSELAVPMIVGGNVIGVFDIQSEQVGRFTEADVNIQTTLAAQLATSIQNARSFEQSRKQAEIESLVNAIGQKIQRTTSIEETLQTAIRELGTAIGASRVRTTVKVQADENTTRRN